MTWSITGGSDALVLGVSTHGNPFIRGVGSHVPYFPDDPAGPATRSDYTAIQRALARLQTVNADWRIFSSAAARVELGNFHAPLVARVDRSSNEPTAEIGCIDDDKNKEPALSFIAVLPAQVFNRVHALFTGMLLAPASLKYKIAFGFHTFRCPGVSVDLPTLEEFLSGVPYFTSELSVSFHRGDGGDA
jgi:hypothetical protein